MSDRKTLVEQWDAIEDHVGQWGAYVWVEECVAQAFRDALVEVDARIAGMTERAERAEAERDTHERMLTTRDTELIHAQLKLTRYRTGTCQRL